MQRIFEALCIGDFAFGLDRIPRHRKSTFRNFVATLFEAEVGIHEYYQTLRYEGVFRLYKAVEKACAQLTDGDNQKRGVFSSPRKKNAKKVSTSDFEDETKNQHFLACVKRYVVIRQILAGMYAGLTMLHSPSSLRELVSQFQIVSASLAKLGDMISELPPHMASQMSYVNFLEFELSILINVYSLNDLIGKLGFQESILCMCNIESQMSRWRLQMRAGCFPDGELYLYFQWVESFIANARSKIQIYFFDNLSHLESRPTDRAFLNQIKAFRAPIFILHESNDATLSGMEKFSIIYDNERDSDISLPVLVSIHFKCTDLPFGESFYQFVHAEHKFYYSPLDANNTCFLCVKNAKRDELEEFGSFVENMRNLPMFPTSAPVRTSSFSFT